MKSNFKKSTFAVIFLFIFTFVNAQDKKTFKLKYETYRNLCEYLELAGCDGKNFENSKNFYMSEAYRLERLVKDSIRKRERNLLKQKDSLESEINRIKTDALISRDSTSKNCRELEMELNKLSGRLREEEKSRVRVEEMLKNEMYKNETLLTNSELLIKESIENTTKLINELKKGKSNEYYDITVFPDNELVKGKVGVYFVVEFKNPIAQSTLFFEIEEYVIDNFDKQYQKSINKFYSDVINVIERDKISDFEIFVKGSADIDKEPKFRKQLKSRYLFNEIKVLKKDTGSSQYSFTEFTHKIPNQYMNTQLPNLRAQFIKAVLELEPYNLQSDKIHILDGSETKALNRFDRNVTIYLYVKR
jgi:hypothetical protein